MEKFLMLCVKFLMFSVLVVTEAVSVMLSVLAYFVLALVICAFFNWGPNMFMVLLTSLAGPCIGTATSITDYFDKRKRRYSRFYF